jgi:hypothetical protein
VSTKYVTDIKYLDGPNIEQIVGYDQINFEVNGVVMFTWWADEKVLVIPLHRIEYMVSKQEGEDT